jgi:hypothetical protein
MRWHCLSLHTLDDLNGPLLSDDILLDQYEYGVANHSPLHRRPSSLVSPTGLAIYRVDWHSMICVVGGYQEER